MDEMTERVRIAREEATRLKEFLLALPEEGWNRASACDRWQVGHVIAHLTGGAERQIESMSRGLKGDANPPPGFVRPTASSISEMNAQRDIAFRERLGDKLLPTFIANYDRLNQLLGGLGPDDWEKPCWHAARGAVSARAYVDLRIQELAIHSWDIRSSFEPKAQLHPDCLPVLMELILPWLELGFRPGPRLPKPIRYRFDVMGPAPSRHDVVVEGDKFTIQPAGAPSADVIFRCNSETYLLLMYGRLAQSAAIAAGRLTTEGDLALSRRFQEWFKGI